MALKSLRTKPLRMESPSQDIVVITEESRLTMCLAWLMQRQEERHRRVRTELNKRREILSRQHLFSCLNTKDPNKMMLGSETKVELPYIA